MYYETLESGGCCPGEERLVLFAAGDDAEAAAVVFGLIEEIGFTQVDRGSLAEGRKEESGTPIYNTTMTEDEAREALASSSVDSQSAISYELGGTMMQAVVVDPNSAGRLTLAEVEEPTPFPSEALVRVEAISLNRGEVRRAESSEPGFRLGWDLAGTVERAADGSGPPEGSRVVGFLPSGAWAELVAVPTDALAVLPEEVSFEEAATLPVAGLTALYALEEGGNLLGRSVLVTGASGGAGQFGVQLARAAGARVVGLVRREEHVGLVEEAGAHEVVVDAGGASARERGPYHLILESVGGEVLGNALSMLATGGTCVSFGVSAGAEATFDARTFYLTGGARLYGFILFHEVLAKPAAGGLARLARMVAEGTLRPRIEVEAPWTEVGEVATRLIERGYTGKAVLHVGGAE